MSKIDRAIARQSDERSDFWGYGHIAPRTVRNVDVARRDAGLAWTYAAAAVVGLAAGLMLAVVL